MSGLAKPLSPCPAPSSESVARPRLEEDLLPVVELLLRRVEAREQQDERRPPHAAGRRRFPPSCLVSGISIRSAAGSRCRCAQRATDRARWLAVVLAPCRPSRRTWRSGPARAARTNASPASAGGRGASASAASHLPSPLAARRAAIRPALDPAPSRAEVVDVDALRVNRGAQWAIADSIRSSGTGNYLLDRHPQIVEDDRRRRSAGRRPSTGRARARGRPVW